MPKGNISLAAGWTAKCDPRDSGIPTPEQSTCLDGRLPSSVVEELSTGTALTYRYCWPGHYCSYVVCQETMFRNIFGPADLATYYCWFTMVHSQDRTCRSLS